MKKTIRGLCLVVLFATLLSIFRFNSFDVEAKENSIAIWGNIYEFENSKNNYEITEDDVAIATQSSVGALTLVGDVKQNGKYGNVPSYAIKSGLPEIRYSTSPNVFNVADEQWHIIEDNGNKAYGISLNQKIKSGVIIIQSSKDGQRWITDVVLCDAFTNPADLSKLYEAQDIQLINGCYYRVIVAYKMERKVGTTTNWVNQEKAQFEEKKVVEQYVFYAMYRDSAEVALNPTSSPLMKLGKVIKTKKDTGYYEEVTLDKDDPHFGREIGQFVINGYTSKTEENREVPEKGWPVFLKNVGDKVTLWFVPAKDFNIETLFGDSKLSISEDTNGYDTFFGVPQTNFKRGTLIIRFTDYQGNVHEPIIYTDFLAANVSTGADTRVQLFEEGNYEVTLDYEIKKDGFADKFTNYKIAFQFEIRNSNCMVYPFDVRTHNELSNESRTENGFYLNMANSRYLKLNVSYYVINENEEGLLTLDQRYNRAAKDNDSYIDPGIYVFKVENLYTGEITEKSIYVGANKYICALARNGLSVSELNTYLSEGALINEDGTISFSSGTELEPLYEEEPDESSDIETNPEENESPSIDDEPQEPIIQTDEPNKPAAQENDPNVILEEEKTPSKLPQIIISVVTVSFVAIKIEILCFFCNFTDAFSFICEIVRTWRGISFDTIRNSRQRCYLSVVFDLTVSNNLCHHRRIFNEDQLCPDRNSTFCKVHRRSANLLLLCLDNLDLLQLVLCTADSRYRFQQFKCLLRSHHKELTITGNPKIRIQVVNHLVQFLVFQISRRLVCSIHFILVGKSGCGELLSPQLHIRCISDLDHILQGRICHDVNESFCHSTPHTNIC